MILLPSRWFDIQWEYEVLSSSRVIQTLAIRDEERDEIAKWSKGWETQGLLAAGSFVEGGNKRKPSGQLPGLTVMKFY